MRVEQLMTAEHIMDVRDLAIAHHEEFGGSREFDSAAVCFSGNKMLEDEMREHGNCWIAYTDDGRAIGYMAASMGSTFHSWRRNAYQQMWFVLPKWRGSRAGVMLVKAFEAWATEKGCEVAYMSVEHDRIDENVRRTERFMNRLGYKTRGMLTTKYLGVVQ